MSLAEDLFLTDWKNYSEIFESWKGLKNIVYIGDIPTETKNKVENLLNPESIVNDRIVNPVQIIGQNTYEIAAHIATYFWYRSDTVVIAPINETFPTPRIINLKYSDSLSANTVISRIGELNSSYLENFWSYENVSLDTGGIFVEINNTNELAMDLLGNFSQSTAWVYDTNKKTKSNWVFFPNVSYPANMDEWGLKIYNTTLITSPIHYELNISVLTYHTYQIQVNNSECHLEIILNWTNSTDDLNVWLLDPSGQLISATSRSGNIYESGYTNKSTSILYPETGNWTILVTRTAGVSSVAYNLTINITEYSSYRHQCVESASNGAVIASSLNKPLLYVTNATIPNATRQAISTLNPNRAILVDPFNLISNDVINNLSALNIKEFVNLTTKPILYEYIYNITQESDLVLSSINDDYFAPASLIAAFHGAPILLTLNESFNIHAASIKNFAIDNWIGFQNPGDSSLLEQDIPRFQDMKNVADLFYNWLNAMNLDKQGNETVLIVSPIAELNPYFDRAIYGKALVGRFSAQTPGELAVFICRNILYPALSYVNLSYKYEIQSKEVSCGGNATITQTQLYANSFSGNYSACQFNDSIYHTYYNASNGQIVMAYYANLSDALIFHENISQIEIVIDGKIGYSNSSIQAAGWGIWNWTAGSYKLIDDKVLNSTDDQFDEILIDNTNLSSFVLSPNSRIEIFILVNTTGPSVNVSVDLIRFNVTYSYIHNNPLMISSSVSYWHNFTFQGKNYNFSSIIPQNFTQYGYQVSNLTGYQEIYSQLDDNCKLWYYSGNSTLPTSEFGNEGNILFTENNYWRAYGDDTDDQGSTPENPDADGDHIVTANNSIGKWQLGTEFNQSLPHLHSNFIILQDGYLGGTQIPEYLMLHGATIVIAGLKQSVVGYSEYLSYVFLNELLKNKPVGSGLYAAFNQTSHLYSLNWEGEIIGTNSFSNYTEEHQQFIIYGDPELILLNTTFDLPRPTSYRPLLHAVAETVTRSDPAYIWANITDLDSELGTEVGAVFNVTGTDGNPVFDDDHTNVGTIYTSPPPLYWGTTSFFDSSSYPWESLGQKTLEWIIFDSNNVIPYTSPIELVTNPPSLLVTQSKTQINDTGIFHDINHSNNIHDSIGRVNESLFVAFNISDTDQDPYNDDWEEFNVTLILENLNDSSVFTFPMVFHTDGNPNDIYSYWTYNYSFSAFDSIGVYQIRVRIEDNDSAVVENEYTGYDKHSGNFYQWFNLINWPPQPNGTNFVITNGTGPTHQVFRLNESITVNASVFDIDGNDTHVQSVTLCFYKEPNQWINITMEDVNLDNVWNATYRFTQFNASGIWIPYIRVLDKDNVTVLFEPNTNISVMNHPPNDPKDLAIKNLTLFDITSVLRNTTIQLFANATDFDVAYPTSNLTLYACLRDPMGIVRYQEIMTYNNVTNQWIYNFTPQITDMLGNWTYYVSVWDEVNAHTNSSTELSLMILNNIPIIKSVNLYPSGGTLNFGETLRITGTVSDVEQLDYIQIFIEDEDGNSINVTQSLTGQSDTFVLEFTEDLYTNLKAGAWNITIKLVDADGNYTGDFTFDSQKGVITINVRPVGEEPHFRFPIEILIIIAIVVTTVLATFLVYRTRKKEETIIPAARVKQIIKKISKEREEELAQARADIKARIKSAEIKIKKPIERPAVTIKEELSEKEKEEINKRIRNFVKEAQMLLEKELFEEAALAYHDAAKLAAKLEKYEMARVYSDKGEEILQKRDELLQKKKRKPKKEKKKKRRPEEFMSKVEIESIKAEIGDIMRNARKSIRDEDYMTAAKLYREVAKLYRKILNEEKAVYFEKKADELL